MNIYIDSCQTGKVIIKIGNQTFTQEIDRPQDQNILGLLDSSLRSMGLDKTQITSVEVNQGPGSFTGSRVGVSVANALAFALAVKVNDQTPPVLPTYSQGPNITQHSK